MKTIRQMVDNFFAPAKPIPPGLYTYQSPPDATRQYRLHLRIDQDGSGALILNARTVLHLNQTAAEMAFHLIQQTPEQEAIKLMASRYRTRQDVIRDDFHAFLERMDTLLSTPDLDPVTFLDFDREELYSRKVTAPFRVDCAVTYRSTDEGRGVHAPHKRVDRELTTEEWQTILRKAYEAGIPHVIFTGGEPTFRPDITELITNAEALGMVTGLMTSGLRLSNPDFLHKLLASGLDHLMIVLDPLEDEAWEGLRDALIEDISITVHLTMTTQNANRIDGVIDRLVQMEVKNLSLSCNDESLKDKLRHSAEVATEKQLSLIWDLPVPYSHLNPVRFELEESQTIPQGAGRAWLYIEPDGDVLPAQGVPQVLGNLLKDDWNTIWEKAQTIAHR